jgi:hypothetical protein
MVRSAPFGFYGNLVSNDWSNDKNGEEHLDRVRGERPNLLGKVRDLRAAIQTVSDQFAAKFGWDKAGLPFARSERDGIKRVRGRDFEITPQYGTTQKGSVAATAPGLNCFQSKRVLFGTCLSSGTTFGSGPWFGD